MFFSSVEPLQPTTSAIRCPDGVVFDADVMVSDLLIGRILSSPPPALWLPWYAHLDLWCTLRRNRFDQVGLNVQELAQQPFVVVQVGSLHLRGGLVDGDVYVRGLLRLLR